MVDFPVLEVAKKNQYYQGINTIYKNSLAKKTCDFKMCFLLTSKCHVPI